MIDIKKIGKGLIKQPRDSRDLNFAMIASVATPVDFTREYRLPNPPDKNQWYSDGCVSYATSYYHWQLKRKDYSQRDLFSRIALDYGAILRDGVKTLCNVGQQTVVECPVPQTPTPQNMRVKSNLPDSAGMDDVEAKYWLGGASIDQLAIAVRDYRGAVFGVYGDDDGWKFELTYPDPPKNPQWAHALYAMGYHLDNGMKCIIAKSSWCDGTHNEHHIKENYFKSGNVFDGWILVPKEILMTKVFKVDDHGKLGVIVFEGYTATGFFADSEDMYNKILAVWGSKIEPNAPVIKIP
jgi:hypothetical protein